MKTCISPGRLAALLLLLFSMLPFGCSTYSDIGSRFKERHTKLVVSLPQGWLRYNQAKDAFVMTRDGLRLEQIAIRAVDVGEELRGTERVYQAGMLPNEIAELSLGLMKARDDTKNFELDKIEATSLAGHDGYLAEAEYVDTGGLPKRLMLCGALFGDYVCEIAYVAARDVYFDKYLPVYEDMLRTAHIEVK